ncbi:MAG TPA: hypothetical protein VIF37_15120 [Methylobacter sp.]|jgi:hypothetical protein
MKLRLLGIAAIYAIAAFFFTAPVYALEDPVGVPMGEIQYGDPNGQQGYAPGDGTNIGSDTGSYNNLQDAAGGGNAADTTFDGSPSSYGSAEGNIGTVVEPNQ